MVLTLVLAAVAPAAAQTPTWEDRAFVNINLGLSLSSRTFTESLAPVIYDERASINTGHDIGGEWTMLDLAGGVRVWGNLGAGAAYTRFSPPDEAAVDARIPHPIYFNQNRNATSPTPLQHTESAIHFQAVYVLPLTERMDVAFAAGPSLISVTQDLVSGVEIAEESPTFATVTVSKVGVATYDQRIVGLNAGADFTYFLTPVAGVGATLRYVRGSVDLPGSGGSSVTVDVGGLQMGVGFRLRIR
jgi:hypothetical protein